MDGWCHRAEPFNAMTRNSRQPRLRSALRQSPYLFARSHTFLSCFLWLLAREIRSDSSKARVRGTVPKPGGKDLQNCKTARDLDKTLRKGSTLL